jgi:DNA-directed RNA polymerase subunit RPC12/RpoP
MATSASTAPRCEPTKPWLTGEHTQLIPEADDWAGGTYTTCNLCGSRVKFRVRGTDRPPSARILPHRVDGTPCR